MSPRDYLLERFSTDAATLRARAQSLQATAAGAPGPDAQASLRMAEACDQVALLVRSVDPDEPPATALQSIAALTLPLEELARANADTPAVRAVYSGAATRIRELLAAEARAAEGGVQSPGAARRPGGFDEPT
jgi:hypothetical protein